MARPQTFNQADTLDKAMLLFWSKGYFNSSATDIVEHTGLSRSSMYNSFTDKHSLFIQSLQHYIDKESQGLQNYLAQLPANPKTLQQLLETVVEENFLGQKPKGCLVVNSAIELAANDAAVKQLIENNLRQVTLAFKQFFKKGQQQGTFNTAIPASGLALLLFHQLTALRVTGKVITDRSFFKKTIQTFIQLLT